MHYIALSLGPNGEVVIDGYPDAEKIVRITGPDALLLSDLNAHRNDLLFAQQCTNDPPVGSGGGRPPVLPGSVAGRTRCVDNAGMGRPRTSTVTKVLFGTQRRDRARDDEIPVGAQWPEPLLGPATDDERACFAALLPCLPASHVGWKDGHLVAQAARLYARLRLAQPLAAQPTASDEWAALDT